MAPYIQTTKLTVKALIDRLENVVHGWECGDAEQAMTEVLNRVTAQAGPEEDPEVTKLKEKIQANRPSS
jgi:hypothetical protein